MTIFRIDPCTDPRWAELLARHPDASVFHTSAWLASLRDTYGFRSVVLTTTAPGHPLQNGIVFSEVKSWLTGSRMVSAPFSDYCQPLLSDPEELNPILEGLSAASPHRPWRYVELRPTRDFLEGASIPGLVPFASYYWHFLNLDRDLPRMFRQFHRTCVRQAVRRAEQEQLEVCTTSGEELLQDFYRLVLLTRRRHGVPPQPLSWFKNLIRHFGSSLKISLARRAGHPLAAILTLRFKHVVVHKYSCSDAVFHNLRSMPLLVWHAIQEAVQEDATIFDMGRTDQDNPGLIAFKDNWGGTRQLITYYRYGDGAKPLHHSSRAQHLAGSVLNKLPDFCLAAAGRLLYRHVG